MNLDEAIEGLEKLIAEVRSASLTDDKTRLGSAMSLRQHARFFNDGVSRFDVIMFGDLDDFKRLNEEHTHDAGDVAINEAGEVIHKVVEGLNGMAFRQSGDEFIILIERNQIPKFLSVASSLRNIRFSYNRKKIQTALSLGYAQGDGRASFEELRERAEIACQFAKAKREGECVEWTDSIKVNPLVRRNGRCLNCGARISCNVPKLSAPLTLLVCPCCQGSL